MNFEELVFQIELTYKELKYFEGKILPTVSGKSLESENEAFSLDIEILISKMEYDAIMDKDLNQLKEAVK